MKPFASHAQENTYAKKNNATTIAGLDEVGRGALAGPFVVGCVTRNISTTFPPVKDSKLFSKSQRHNVIVPLLSQCSAWSVGIVEANEISQHGMAWAIIEGFTRALRLLPQQPDIVFYDGRQLPLSHPHAVNIVHGDVTHATIAASSIIAKVIRDLFMQDMHDSYPHYNFFDNKGYGTLTHRKALKKYGALTGVHRTSFVDHLLV